jgi:hypothetical protein
MRTKLETTIGLIVIIGTALMVLSFAKHTVDAKQGIKQHLLRNNTEVLRYYKKSVSNNTESHCETR